jgi:hypothetical protein
LTVQNAGGGPGKKSNSPELTIYHPVVFYIYIFELYIPIKGKKETSYVGLYGSGERSFFAPEKCG